MWSYSFPTSRVAIGTGAALPAWIVIPRSSKLAGPSGEYTYNRGWGEAAVGRHASVRSRQRVESRLLSSTAPLARRLSSNPKATRIRPDLVRAINARRYLVPCRAPAQPLLTPRPAAV